MTDDISPAALYAEASAWFLLDRAAPGHDGGAVVEAVPLEDVLADAGPLRTALVAAGVAPAKSVDRLVRIAQELASNALEHARPEHQLRILDDGTQWVVAVTDAAPERAPALPRDLAAATGLPVVVQLSDRHGAHYEHEHKVVWAAVRKSA